MGMPGKSFQSKLEPHFDFILEARRKRQTLEDIAQALAAHGITTTKQAVHAFIKRRLKRRYALGMAPEMKPSVPNLLPKHRCRNCQTCRNRCRQRVSLAPTR